MAEIPKKINNFLSKIRENLPEILGDNLYGIYIYGSLTYGGFNPVKSDIDCVVVVREALTKKEIQLLKNWYKKLLNNPLAKRLEMAYAIKKNLILTSGKTAVSRTPLFFKGKFFKKADSDAYNPIIWLNIKNNGYNTFGALARIICT